MSGAFSIVRGLVSSNQDPDKLGRVKVRFPFLGGKAKDNESPWCRVARPVSHSEAGDWILPDEGDEVLVAFENNDLSRPIVLGSLFSDDRKPPQTGRSGDYNQDGKNTLRAMTTASGHALIFDDASGKEAVIVKDSQGHSITLDKDGVSIKTKDGDSIQMKSSGITIQSAQSVKISGSSKVELGEGASKSLVFGEDLLQAFNNHTHIYAATMSMGTTNPPTAPMTPSLLSKKVKTC